MSDVRAIEISPRTGRGGPDYLLIFAVAALTALGLLMILTVSAPRLEAAGLGRTDQVVRQSIFVAGGVAAFAVASLISDRRWKAAAPYIYGLALILLIAVLSPIGALRQGAQRWIPLGLFDLQPSEVAKPAVILTLATFLVPVEESKMRWWRIIRVMALVAVPGVLIFQQPDLGTMMVFGFVAVVMLFVAGTNVRQIIVLLVLGVVALIAAFQLDVLHDYQLERLTGFLRSGEETLTVNYSQTQSRIAIGSGGLFGKGVFEGSQTNLAFVPAQTTDFIFTAVGEQLGFVGGAIVIGLYAVILWRLLMISANARDRFGQLAVAGIAAMIAFHVFVNVGMTLGLLPVTGLPLPLMSFGGSFYGAIALSFGIANSIWMRRSRVPGERHLL